MAGEGDTPPDDGVDFHHPYTPYDVQLNFMKTAYGVLQRGDGQIGILESPTGTGKSLSLICSALTWLRNFKRSQLEVSLGSAAEEFKDEPDWIVQQLLQRKRKDLVQKWEEREERLRRIREKEKQMEIRVAKKRRLEESGQHRPGPKAVDEESEFLVDDWNDDDTVDDKDPLSQLSRETRALLKEMGMGAPSKGDEDEDEDEDAEDEIKIFYTSRTHSQLTQFVSELRRPTFPSSIPSAPSNPSTSSEDQTDGVKHVPLSSRQRLCINPGVARLSSVSAINDRCAELQKPKSKSKCAFLPGAEKISQTHQFRDTALATLPDIEDLHQLGKTLQVCPYYASRTAIPGAEVITLPYPLLLQQSARDALGIKLEGNVVVIDEAHNIMDAVASVNAAEVRLTELRRARQMLGEYVRRFGKKLKGENRVMIGQLAKVVDALSEWLNIAAKSKACSSQGIVNPNDLLKHKGADQINLFRLVRYVQESKLAFKVESYASYAEEQDKGDQAKPASSTPVLHTLVSFLIALTNLSTEGRIFYEKLAAPSTDIKLSYLLLSPTHAFSSIATSARAVILAGGTMSPFEDYKAHLFPTLAPTKITTLSCGHVIPPSNLCVWTLASPRPGTTSGPDSFEFSFQRRSDAGMVRQLGMALLNICGIVPDGVVMFFPSYGYLDEVVSIWQGKDVRDNQKSIWDRLQEKKAVFRESKGGSSDEVLNEYSNAILGDAAPGTKRNGALLLSVVGGKMSEGINFSDRLGRCVVIVGLPYPNINSAEWKARIEYIESSTLARLTAGSNSTDADEQDTTGPKMSRDQAVAASKQAARDFYENACMRAVNQSIGRAIRHRNDYAAIVLVDRRFGTERIKGKLPGWIRGGMVAGSEEKGLPGLMGALSGFFRGKKGA